MKEMPTEIEAELSHPSDESAEPNATVAASDPLRAFDFMPLVARGAKGDLATLTPREKVFALEEALAALDVEQLDIPEMTRHTVNHGVYVREVTMPADSMFTGMIHKHEHIAMCTMGDVSIYDEDGLRRLKAGDSFVSRPGVKRALFTHAETKFINIFRLPNPNETNPEALTKEFFAVTEDEFQEHLRQLSEGGSASGKALPANAKQAIVDAETDSDSSSEQETLRESA